MLSPHRAQSRLQAVTLIEVVVVSALVVVIAGVLLGILIEARRSSDQGQARLAMIEEAQSVADEIVAILESAVAPTSLDEGVSTATLRFAPDHFSLISSRGFPAQDKNFYLWTVRSARDEAGRETVSLAVSVLDATRTTGTPRETRRSLGTGDTAFNTSARFEYADQIRVVGPEPDYHAELPQGIYPRVVRLRVRVSAPRSPFKPFELVTAVRLL